MGITPRRGRVLRTTACCLLGAAIGAAPIAFSAESTGAQLARGGEAYQHNCTNGCHMPDLRAGAFAPALSGHLFVEHWQGLAVGELYERVRNTMPQQKPHSLDDQTYVDIVAFLLRSNGGDIGQELQSDPDALGNMVIRLDGRQDGHAD
jgi:hypothetical protein